ncbi:hypothetical protein LFWB_6310 [Candidatus Phytoplasma luffae]|uniref:Uncharacterized protein n=1 Tax=Loofah witches'-broom phytoplasma TaxID=35773 RepID=A0A975FJM0_LOWBP|nr:hypothetical protein [Candidatus Phytoplasma luffae]QTX03194.1 hypothetical protein LFWB_6310 [Candidatus Phytoplasma luffae]
MLKINNIKCKIYFFIFIFLSMIFLILAIYNNLQQYKEEEIKLLNDFPVFEVEYVGGDNKKKTLIPIEIPNFNIEKYKHLINVEHSAILFSKQMQLKEPLFLKIKIILDTKNTFDKPEDYFNLRIITVDKNNKKEIYAEDHKPCYFEMEENEIQKIQINTQIEQIKIINTLEEPKLFLLYNYEIVDSQGKSIIGGTNEITQNIQNIVNK